MSKRAESIEYSIIYDNKSAKRAKRLTLTVLVKHPAATASEASEQIQSLTGIKRSPTHVLLFMATSHFVYKYNKERQINFTHIFKVSNISN